MGPQLREYGFEQPEQLAATFIMDGQAMREWARNSLPLTDNFPQRIFGKLSDVYEYMLSDLEEVMNPDKARECFQRSASMAKIWPASLRMKSLTYFPVQRIINDGFVHPDMADTLRNAESLYVMQTQTTVEVPGLAHHGRPRISGHRPSPGNHQSTGIGPISANTLR